jgi:predicted enzyme related to lactoylglutathione lyase
VSDIDALAARLTKAGSEVAWDDLVAGARRFFTHDPLGNRLEFIAAKA